jgi:antitoxin (DNA-binding transcriptional repressor) of toxin-antitoxin stability system
MKTIGVRDLKAQLSRVLREVRAGETVLVTDRGEVVAELRTPDGGTFVESRTERILARLASAGALRVAERPAEPYRASPVRANVGLAQQLLDEGRGDRLVDSAGP